MSLKHHKRVAVTATTGMASTQLGFDSTTLHHWSGILDGRYSLPQLKELFDHDDKFAAAKLRIEKTECLMIDEISMLSKKILELVESVCRHVRKSQHMFGGIQVRYKFSIMTLLWPVIASFSYSYSKSSCPLISNGRSLSKVS